jgi:hypothetical protein
LINQGNGFQDLRVDQLGNGWGGRRAGAGRKPGSAGKRTIAKVKTLATKAHRETDEPTPLAILMDAARNESLPLELRLAAARAAAPFYHARVSSGPAKAAHEMSLFELQSAIDRQKEHLEREAHPGFRNFRVVGSGN